MSIIFINIVTQDYLYFTAVHKNWVNNIFYHEHKAIKHIHKTGVFPSSKIMKQDHFDFKNRFNVIKRLLFKNE